MRQELLNKVRELFEIKNPPPPFVKWEDDRTGYVFIERSTLIRKADGERYLEYKLVEFCQFVELWDKKLKKIQLDMLDEAIHDAKKI
jgi:hypothetical protein